MFDRQTLVAQLRAYHTSFSEEHDFIKPFLELLAQKDCFERTCFPGHITGSAWIVDRSREHVLLVHHAKLNKWLQPGGHADGDDNILRVALREAEEETGLKNIKALEDKIFDIDIHTIPARKEIPEHLHYDVRFILTGDISEKIVVSEESHEVTWIRLKDLQEFNQEQSVLRMRDKLTLL